MKTPNIVVPLPNDDETSRLPTATRRAKLHYCNLRCVVCMTPTHAFPTCYLSSCCVENIAPTDSFMATSQGILRVMGKKKEGDGNKTLLLPIKPQWNLTMLRFTIDGVSWLLLYRPRRNITFSLSTQSVWEMSATQEMVTTQKCLSLSACDKEMHGSWCHNCKFI